MVPDPFYPHLVFVNCPIVRSVVVVHKVRGKPFGCVERGLP